MKRTRRAGRSHPVIGLDLGSTEVRAAKVSVPSLGKDGKVTVSAVAARPISDGAVSEGRILSPGSLGSTIDAVLDDIGAKRRAPLCVALSGKLAGLTQVLISNQFEPSEWSATVESGLGRISPSVSVPEAHTSVIAIERDDRGTTLAVAGAHNDLMNALQAAVKRSSAHLAVVELAASALLRSHLHIDQDSEGVLVHIGASHTLIVGRHGANITYVESIPEGTNAIVSQLAADFGISTDDASNLTRTLWATDRDLAPRHNNWAEDTGTDEDFFDLSGGGSSDEEPDQQRYGQVFTSAVDRLVDIVSSAIETVQDDPDDPGLADPAGVALTGTGALLNGLPNRFEVRLGLPTHGALPWATFKVNDKTRTYLVADPSDPAKNPRLHVPAATYRRFGIAIGAAMHPLVN